MIKRKIEALNQAVHDRSKFVCVLNILGFFDQSVSLPVKLFRGSLAPLRLGAPQRVPLGVPVVEDKVSVVEQLAPGLTRAGLGPNSTTQLKTPPTLLWYGFNQLKAALLCYFSPDNGQLIKIQTRSNHILQEF